MGDIRGAEHFLSSRPLIWPKGGFRFDSSDAWLKVERDPDYKHRETYAVQMGIYSAVYANFLDKVAALAREIPSCPRIARVPGSSSFAALGHSWWVVLKPEYIHTEVDGLDNELYRPGRRFVRVGYSVALEESLTIFIREVVGSLQDHAGLLAGFMADGYITQTLGAFDFFYGFVFSCHRAGKTAVECFELMPDTGITEMYSDEYDFGKIKKEDIKLLYELVP